MRISEIMTNRIATVALDDTIETAERILQASAFHHLLVVEGKTLLGVVSDRDLLRALSPYIGSAVETTRDLATLDKRMHQVMSRNLHTLTPDASVQDAIKLLLAHGISCVPIVNEENQPVGIVSWRDILETMAE